MDSELYDVLWDALLDNGIEPNDTLIKEWAVKIPRQTQGLAMIWGWGDTEVREELHVFIREELKK